MIRLLQMQGRLLTSRGEGACICWATGRALAIFKGLWSTLWQSPLGDKRLQGEEGVPGNSFNSTYVYLGWVTQKEAKTKLQTPEKLCRDLSRKCKVMPNLGVPKFKSINFLAFDSSLQVNEVVMSTSLPHPFSICMELLLMDLPSPSQMWLLLLMLLPRTARPRGPTPLGVKKYYVKTYLLLFVLNRAPVYSISSSLAPAL